MTKEIFKIIDEISNRINSNDFTHFNAEQKLSYLTALTQVRFDIKEWYKSISLQDKVDLVKELLEGEDIMVTGAYGAFEYIDSDSIYIAVEDEYYQTKGKTIVINSGICTG